MSSHAPIKLIPEQEIELNQFKTKKRLKEKDKKRIFF